MSKKIKSTGHGVVLEEADIINALRFHRNNLALQGKISESNIEDVTEENIDELIDSAMDLGFSPYGGESTREFELAVLDSNVNNGTPKVFTSFFGNSKNLLQYKVRMVSIAIFQPRFMKAEQRDIYAKLAPTAAMLNGVKNKTMGSAEYREKYDAILSKLDPKEVYSELAAFGKGKDVAILCYEKLPDTCHRHYVTEWLEKGTGIEILEFPYIQ